MLVFRFIHSQYLKCADENWEGTHKYRVGILFQFCNLVSAINSTSDSIINFFQAIKLIDPHVKGHYSKIELFLIWLCRVYFARSSAICYYQWAFFTK